MEIDFGGKVALVTGAADGIGKETAIQLLECNAKVIALDINEVGLESLKTLYPKIETVRADVSDWNGVKKIVEGLEPIDLLVNNAGILEMQNVGSITEESLSRILDINVKSVFNISQVVSNSMIARGTKGSIVNLASISSKVPTQGFGAYCASKAAVSMLTRVLALELGPHQIRVNSVSPTIVAPTQMGQKCMGGHKDGAGIQTMLARHPLGRFAEPKEIANAIVFLLSDRASLIHGTNLPVDAGLLAA